VKKIQGRALCASLLASLAGHAEQPAAAPAAATATTQQQPAAAAAPAKPQASSDDDDDDVNCDTETQTGSLIHKTTTCTSSASRTATQNQINEMQRMPGR
jgi:hypothetical protein